ncbi:MAG: leucine--tRNA ligase [Planctomycetota bacterium]|nr:leucine--tRNA ligase [Planctomycetota bacterium]
MPRYEPKRIEPKWQSFWDQHQTFRVENSQVGDHDEKLYVLDMFPYPSGNGLHVGHPEGYTATDIVCRYNRMLGKQVLHPMGWDAFGLPAEEHAIQTGTHPAVTTDKNIDTFRRQLKMLGFSYDWSREFATTDADYYRWTQWIFLQLFDTWYDSEFTWTGPDCVERTGKGRPIAELPIPAHVAAEGAEAARRYQDSKRLAYQHEAPVNWCPALGTVLANEEVQDGKSDRGGHPVERFPLRQWMLRITAYGDRLIHELENLNWPESIKDMQRNWIGRSTGAEVDFYIGDDADAWKATRQGSGFPEQPGEDVLRVYTTRPDTLYGATYMVLAPEHPFVDRLTTSDQKAAVDTYVRQATLKSDLDRTDLAKSKTGVFTGSFATNPVNGERVPIWIADYVLISYGTGAIMAVPAHDLRDWEFAVTFDIPIIQVVQAPDGYQHSKDELALAREVDGTQHVPFAGKGTVVNSDKYNGLSTDEFKATITEWLSDGGLGHGAVNYRLRDWLFSRQRYWGEPFPIWHELDADGNQTGLLRADSHEDLPVRLPEMEKFKPTGTPEPMLSTAPESWLFKTASDGTKLKRETNTMPQWAGSCWYYLRFADPKNEQCFLDPNIEKKWLPVDLYVGGAEHAVLHLLYSRFWHKVLFDRGHVTTCEPFQRLVNQGMILGETEYTGFQTDDGRCVSSNSVSEQTADDGSTAMIEQATGTAVTASKLQVDQVEKKGDNFVLASDKSVVVDARAFKMSKSRGNVINPDDVVNLYGADSLRLYEMFMGPLEQVKPWNMSGVEGISRFLGRVWRMITDENADEAVVSPTIQDVELDADQSRLLHKTIKAVTGDIEKLSFNTAISRMMEFTNEFTGAKIRPRSAMEPFVLLLAPFAPHLAEELWSLLGHDSTLAYEAWPPFDDAKIAEAEIEVPVQVNGKLRAKIKVPADAKQAALQAAAEADDAIQAQIAGKHVVKVVVIPGRMVNFVVKG